MCIIAVCLQRALSDDEIEKCWKGNKDGGGIAWQNDGYLCFVKGMMTLDAFKEQYDAIKHNIPHIAHFRTSTARGVMPELTHPFLITEESPLVLEYYGKDGVLFHNGVMSSWEETARDFFITKMQPVPAGEFSDSRVIAIICASLTPNFVGLTRDKFAIMDGNGISTYGGFQEEKGVLFSNGGYKYTTTYNTYAPATGKWQNDKPSTPTSTEPKTPINMCVNPCKPMAGHTTTPTSTKKERKKTRKGNKYLKKQLEKATQRTREEVIVMFPDSEKYPRGGYQEALEKAFKEKGWLWSPESNGKN